MRGPASLAPAAAQALSSWATCLVSPYWMYRLSNFARHKWCGRQCPLQSKSPLEIHRSYKPPVEKQSWKLVRYSFLPKRRAEANRNVCSFEVFDLCEIRIRVGSNDIRYEVTGTLALGRLRWTSVVREVATSDLSSCIFVRLIGVEVEQLRAV